MSGSSESGSSEDTSDLVAWKEVHSSLIEAVKSAKAAVDAQKAQRRFWLEEICSNLNEQGKLTPTSVWKRPDTAPKKGHAARSSLESKTTATKRKKKESAADVPAKKPRKKASISASVTTATTEDDTGGVLNDEEANEPKDLQKKKPKIKISRKLPMHGNQHSQKDLSENNSQSATLVPAVPIPPPPEFMAGGQSGGAFPSGLEYSQGQWSQGSAQTNLQMMVSAICFRK